MSATERDMTRATVIHHLSLVESNKIRLHMTARCYVGQFPVEPRLNEPVVEHDFDAAATRIRSSNRYSMEPPVRIELTTARLQGS